MTWGVFRAVVGTKENKYVEMNTETEYQTLLRRRDALRQEREECDRLGAEERRAVVLARINELPAPVPEVDRGEERALVDEVLQEVERRLADPELVRAHVEARTAAVARERDRLRAEVLPFREALDRARAAVDEAQRALLSEQSKRGPRLDDLDREVTRLRLLQDAVDVPPDRGLGETTFGSVVGVRDLREEAIDGGLIVRVVPR